MASKTIRNAGHRAIELDDRVHSLFEPYADTPPIQALDVLSKFGDQPELRLAAGGLIVAGTFSGNDRLVRAGARMMIAHEAATLAKNLIKSDVDRTRPRSADSRSETKPRKGAHTAKEKTSFPSGHSAGAIAAARAFSREFPQHAAVTLAAAGLIAACQIPRRAHYPTDVAAGLLLGLAAEALVNAAWSAAQMDERSTG